MITFQLVFVRENLTGAIYIDAIPNPHGLGWSDFEEDGVSAPFLVGSSDITVWAEAFRAADWEHLSFDAETYGHEGDALRIKAFGEILLADMCSGGVLAVENTLRYELASVSLNGASFRKHGQEMTFTRAGQLTLDDDTQLSAILFVLNGEIERISNVRDPLWTATQPPKRKRLWFGRRSIANPGTSVTVALGEPRG